MNRTTSLSVMGYNIFTGNREYFSDVVAGVVATLNPHSFIIARRDGLFREALQKSDILLPDGVGIKLAARVLEGRTIEKITGSDLHEMVITALDKRGGSCFYLGSSTETLQLIEKRATSEHPSLRSAGYSPPYREQFTPEESNEMICAVNSFAPDVLFVGMTAPKQEKWVYEHRAELKVPLICSIGAVFDFYAGTVRRSGRIWIRLGLEWLPRLMREPRRLWKRNFISTPLFLWYLFAEKGSRLKRRPERKTTTDED